MTKKESLPLILFTGTLFGLMPLVWVEKLVDPVLMPQCLILALCLGGISVWGGFKNGTLKLELPKGAGLALLGMLGFFALSLVNATNVASGLFELLRWLTLGGLFLGFSHLLRTQPDFKSLVWKVLVVATLIQASTAQFHWLSYVQIDASNPNPVGTHTNSNLFGLSFLLVIPFLVQAAFAFKKEWRYAAVLATLVALFMAYQSGSRASSLSLLVGSGMLLPLVVYQLIKTGVSVKWKGIAVAVLLVVLAGTWMGNKITFVKKMGSEKFDLILAENPTLANSAPSLDHRMVLWNKTIRMWEDAPLLGVGLGNWKFKIQQYGFQAADDKGNYGMDIPQRPHNIFLQIASESGILALIGYLTLVGMAIWYSVKQAFSRDRKVFIQGAGLLVFWIGFLISTTFNFPLERPFHGAVIFFALALSFSRVEGRFIIPLRSAKAVGVGIATLMVVFCIFKMKGEQFFKEVKQLKVAKNWEGVMRATEDAGDWFTPVDPESGVPMEWYRGIAALSTNRIQEGLQQMQAASAIAPYHLAVRSNLAGAYNMNQQLPEAASTYKSLVETFPDFEDARLNLALTYAQMGDYEGAKEELNKIVSMKNSPRYLTLYNQLQSLPK